MLYRFSAFEFVEIGSADYQILGEIIDSNIPLLVQQELTMATFGSFRSKLVDWHWVVKRSRGMNSAALTWLQPSEITKANFYLPSVIPEISCFISMKQYQNTSEEVKARPHFECEDFKNRYFGSKPGCPPHLNLKQLGAVAHWSIIATSHDSLCIGAKVCTFCQWAVCSFVFV